MLVLPYSMCLYVQNVYLPAFVPPVARPGTADREDNSLVPFAIRGPFDYQVRVLNSDFFKRHDNLSREVINKATARDGQRDTLI